MPFPNILGRCSALIIRLRPSSKTRWSFPGISVTLGGSSNRLRMRALTLRLGGGDDCLLSRIDPLTEVTSMGQKVIFQPAKYLDHLSGRGLGDISRVPGQTVGCANFMLRNPLPRSGLNGSKIKASTYTPKDRDIVEYSALSKAYHLPRLQVLKKISQSFGSFLGLWDIGIRHLLRQKRAKRNLLLKRTKGS